ncbi:MAG TPA: response regulator transcription factor [Polyangiaceae bacterium]|nr:response regulator transcription factor [Polyangiaceae bacterium]
MATIPEGDQAGRGPHGLEGRHVLVVEDDPSIALGLRINLEAEGYRVTSADDGEKALALIRAEPPDLMLLDVMMPRKNGFEVIHELRREGIVVPIIVLSARTGEMDKVTGLELGAEDYVAKPFSLAELLARVRVALRRRAVAPRADVVRFSSVEVDVSARAVKRGGEHVELTATEFDVLMCLVANRGKALSRDDIFRTVWGPNHHGTPRTIDNFLQQLRQKLEVDAASPRHFLTVRGVGYRFDG